MDDVLEFALAKPVKLGTVELTKLALKEPTAAQLRRAASAENGVASDLLLIHLVANIDLALVEMMGARDFMKAARWLGNFTRSETPDGNG